MDPDQVEARTDVGTPDAARVAVTAANQRPHRDQRPTARLRRQPSTHCQQPSTRFRAQAPEETDPRRPLRTVRRKKLVVAATDAQRFGREQHLANAGFHSARSAPEQYMFPTESATAARIHDLRPTELAYVIGAARRCRPREVSDLMHTRSKIINLVLRVGRARLAQNSRANGRATVRPGLQS